MYEQGPLRMYERGCLRMYERGYLRMYERGYLRMYGYTKNRKPGETRIVVLQHARQTEAGFFSHDIV